MISTKPFPLVVRLAMKPFQVVLFFPAVILVSMMAIADEEDAALRFFQWFMNLSDKERQ